MSSHAQMPSLIRTLQARGPMYVQPYTFETVVAYLLGFEHCLVASGRKSYLADFTEWLNDLVGRHCSLHWSAVIREVFAKKDGELALQKMFEFFRAFEKTRNGSKVNGATTAKKRRRQAPIRQ